MSLKLTVGAAIAATLAALAPVSASAVSVPFERITSNSSADAAAQLTLDVTDGGTVALFDFGVLSGANPGANIAEIYFSDTSSLFTDSLAVVSQSSGVDFSTGSASPPNLPSGNTASPAFTVTPNLLAEASGNNATGLTVGEDLVLSLAYGSGVDFSDLLSGLDSGAFRVGLHVRSLLAGESDSFVSTPPTTTVVPVPAALPLMLSALGGLAFVGRRKKR